MSNQARSLRPRHSVDYTARNAISQTPGWLKKSEPKVQSDPEPASKENKLPGKSRTQHASAKSAGAKQRRQSEPAEPSRPQSKSKDAREQKTAPTVTAARQGTSSQLTTNSGVRQAASSQQDTHSSAGRAPAAPDSGQQGDKDRPAEDWAEAADEEVFEPAAAELQSQGQGQKRKAQSAPANNRKRKLAEPDKPARISARPSEAQPTDEDGEQIKAPDPALGQHQQHCPPSVAIPPEQLQIEPSLQQQRQQQGEPQTKTTLDASIAQQQPPSRPSENFMRLQADYSDLLKRFEELQGTRLGQVDNILHESQTRGEHLSEAARKLADHYKREAELLSQKAQVSHAAKLEAEVQSLRQQVNELEGRRLEAEEQVLREQEQATQLALELGEAKQDRQRLQTELHAARQLAERPDCADKCIQVDLHPLAAPASLQSQPQQTAQPSVAGPSPAACDLEDLKMQSPSQMSAQPPRQPSIHLQEAKAWCPEGAELSEAYTAPHHIPGASNNDSESWQVQPQAVVPGAGGNADAAAAQGPLEGGSPQLLQQLSLVSQAYNSPLAPSPLASQATPIPANALVPYPISSALPQHRTPLTRFAAEALQQDRQPPLPTSELVLRSHQATTADAAGKGPGALAARQLQYPSGSGNSAILPSPAAAIPALAAVAAQSPSASSAFSDAHPLIANQALEALVGLHSRPTATGGFQYAHSQSGYVFELQPVLSTDHDDSEDEHPANEELAYRPITLGTAGEVLPNYLCGEIRFDVRLQKHKVVGRIMDSLGKWKPQKA